MIETLFVFLVGCFGGLSATPLHSIQMSNYDTLMGLYNSGNYSMKDFIPKSNVSDPFYVGVAVDLLALTDFNEVTGSIDLMIALNLTWTDEIPQCNGYAGYHEVFNITGSYPDALKTLLVPYGKIWAPDIVLINAMGSDTPIGGSNYKLRVDLLEGLIIWNPKVHVYTSCSPDVTYFPFDEQTCTFTFSSWGHRESELLFRTNGIFSFDNLSGNGEWSIKSAGVYVLSVDSRSRFEATITIERRPLYFAFNIISPIMVLVILNGMVFWLPIESGERVGFSVTCFLSFVVLLNTIMGMMPESSAPMAFLCFYTVCMMVFSGLTTALVILQMKMFYKPEDDEVPRCLVAIIRFMKCQPCKRRRNQDKISLVKVKPAQEKGKVNLADNDLNSLASFEDQSEETRVTWQDSAKSLDLILFLCFVIGQMFFTISFLVPLFVRI